VFMLLTQPSFFSGLYGCLVGRRVGVVIGAGCVFRVLDLFADLLHPGEQQSEVDHGIQSERSETGEARDRKWRHALPGGYFEFQMKALRNTPQVLSVTYFGSDSDREFDILVDGKRLATQTLERNQPDEFFDVEYPIPAEMIADRDRVTVRFQSRASKIAGGVYRCALLKAASP